MHHQRLTNIGSAAIIPHRSARSRTTRRDGEEPLLRYAILARNLTKRFPKPGHLAGVPLPFTSGDEQTLAVDHVTLEVERGEVFGVVGPNGAGKTTLVKMLATLILPTSGSARVNGFDLRSENERLIKASIGLVTSNERSFYPRLSCWENLRFYAGLQDLPGPQTRERIAELSDLLRLDEILHKQYQTCSTGMKHRLALARSLINDPRLLLLDEPTRSLDPLAAARFRQAVYALTREGDRTVLLVTHDLAEAEEMCDRVGLMWEGQLRVTDAPTTLRRLLTPDETCAVRVRGFTPDLLTALRQMDEVEALTEWDVAGDVAQVKLRLQDRKRGLATVTRVIGERGASVEDLTFDAVSWGKAFASLDEASPSRLEVTSTPRGTHAQPAEAETRYVEEKQKVSTRTAGGRPLAKIVRRILSKPLLFLHRDLKTQMSYRLSLLLQLMGILFSSTSFFFMAGLLGDGAGQELARYGGDYFAFVLIGIAFVGYQNVALYTFSGVIRSAQSMGTLEAVLATPTRLGTILLSSSLWPFAFTSLRVVVYLLAGTFVFGADLSQANLVGGIVVLGLSVLTLSSIGILSACFVMVVKRGSPINFVISSLSALLAGVYYPVTVLPDWLQRTARVFPLTYSLEAMRRALLSGQGLGQLARPVAALFGFSLLLLPLSLVAFHHAVQQAKRDGSLTHF